MMTEAGPLDVRQPSLSVATGDEVKGRRLLRPGDVDAIVGSLQSVPVEEDDDDDAGSTSPASRRRSSVRVEARGLSREEIDAILADPTLPDVMKQVQRLLPDIQLVGVAESPEPVTRDATPLPDFCTPTAVDDIFASLSDLGKAVGTIAKASGGGAAAAPAVSPTATPDTVGVDVLNDAAVVATARENSPESDRTFAGVTLDLPAKDVQRLRDIMECDQQNSETLQQLEEQLAIEQWEREGKKQTETRVLCPNRTFMDSDIVSYPYLLGTDKTYAKPATSEKAMSINEDPTYSWADARLHIQSSTETHEAYARDVEQLLELQNTIATIEARQADRKHDMDRRRRQCAFVHNASEPPLPLAATRGPYVFDVTAPTPLL